MNLYVSNLSFGTADNDLRKLFAQFGEVASAKVITDRETGRSRGFGFVEMPSDKEANDAIKALNNKEVEGRPMSVTVAKPKEDKEIFPAVKDIDNLLLIHFRYPGRVSFVDPA